MQSIIFVFTMLIFAFEGTAWSANPLPWEVPTPFESGVIDYTVKGTKDNRDGVKGNMTLFFTEYGKNRAMRFIGKVKDDEGNWSDMDVTSIVTPESVISVNIMKDREGGVHKEGRKWTNPARHYAASYARLSDEKKKEYRRISKSEKTQMEFNGMLLNFGTGKPGKVAGYSCDSLQIMTVDMCFLEGSPIPIEGSAIIYDFTARKITPNARVSSTHFQPPAGVELVVDPEQEESSKQMAVMFVENAVKIAGITNAIKGIFSGGSDDSGQDAGTGQKSAPKDEDQPENDPAKNAGKAINEGINKLKSIFGN
ncbi:MAG: hypothetical protein OEZ32_05355 [Nitrospinota bacterium]|nr:hypothetical protein [Nitrospinota bacterium]